MLFETECIEFGMSGVHATTLAAVIDVYFDGAVKLPRTSAQDVGDFICSVGGWSARDCRRVFKESDSIWKRLLIPQQAFARVILE